MLLNRTQQSSFHSFLHASVIALCLRSRALVMAITSKNAVLRFLQREVLSARPLWPNILDNCLTCPFREEHLFCNLSVQAGQRLNEIKSTAVYPKGAMLFIEGQQPRGVFVLCAGSAKLSTSSREGKTIITKLSDAGDVLGLNSVVSNRPYEVTVEMMEPGQANFIPRDSLLQFLRDNGEVALRVGEQLSRNYYTAYEEIRTLVSAPRPRRTLPSCFCRGRPKRRRPTELRK
jgi:CRP-like cAMP-binding protein